ncbi:uncharacterized protein LOC119611960 [Lucilia sericata]|uniref:uncharacterized protein LOC119611960 n=1 Tax=Lucilia sericata TaxID=13632 RepID=UPI0018A87733|nr:uncharacterized protein LOC119611960 [Lucilia sericata]
MLGLISDCVTSFEIWLKLESTFQTKGPARKATLLKRAAFARMKDRQNKNRQFQGKNRQIVTLLFLKRRIVKSGSYGYDVCFYREEAHIIENSRIGNLYYLVNSEYFAGAVNSVCNIDMWHFKMGHLNDRDLNMVCKLTGTFNL